MWAFAAKNALKTSFSPRSWRVLFGEGRSFEFRTEAFNLTNTPPFGAPATVVGAEGFGSITSAGDPRVIQFGAKLNF